jgi:hypothetical protein
MQNTWRRPTLLLMALALLSLPFISHGDDDEEVKMESLEINKDSIAEGISMLEKSGQITPEQAKAARDDLNKKSAGEIEALKMHDMERVKSGNIPTLPLATGNTTTVKPTVATEAPSELAPASTPTAVIAPAAPAAAASATTATQNTDAKLKEALQFIQK